MPLHPDLKSADLPKVEAYNDFVRLTDVDTLLPGVDLRLSFPRNYARLVRHIALFRYLNRESGEDPREWPEAMHAWYEQLYTPIMGIIDSCDMMQDFPDRTSTDLYLWLVTNFRRFHQRLPSPDEIPVIEGNLKHYLAPFWIPPN